VDSQILKSLNKRTELTVDVGRLKAKKGISPYVPEREREVYEKMVRKNIGPITDASLKAIYREIMSGALSLMKQLKVAYLGPPYTFTHIASLKKFGSSIQYEPCDSITDCFTEVEKGRCDYAVVPIENSTEGVINHTLDMFIDSDMVICSEVYLNISHNLLAKCKKSQIKRIYSNPQVFGQCRLWLERNLPTAEFIEVSSTTRAAEIASRTKNAACIASSLAGEMYKLRNLARSIQDSAHNVTRFLVIGRTITNPTGRDKTSILFTVKDRVGALHDILVPFKRSKVNLTKIESRPSKKRAWKYYFFVDMEGHLENPRVKKALNGLEKGCTFFKVLGSYPAG